MCIFTILMAATELPSLAETPTGKEASIFGYTLNDEIFKYGVISTKEEGGDVEMNCKNGIYPAGIIYADMIDFDNNKSPYLVIFRADSVRGCVSADVYNYNEEKKKSELVTIISKGCNLSEGTKARISIGDSAGKSYIIYNEYVDGQKSESEYYTILDDKALRYVTSPGPMEDTAIVSFTCENLHPEMDVSDYNKKLDDFFCDLKDGTASSVTQADISDLISEEEEGKLEEVLSNAADFYDFEITRYHSIPEYTDALERKDFNNIFYSITNMYDLGDQIYYVRFATDNSFYNYALLRRTSSLDEGYQLLCAKTDTIPLSIDELMQLKNEYMHNNLLYKKARGSILDKEKSSLDLKKLSVPKIIKIPKLIDHDWRKPIALISGGICVVLFVVLWVYMASEESEA